MSFILDALKKSEAERRRQAGPTLYEMRAAPRRASLPTGIVVLLVVLSLNLVGLAYLLLRKPATPGAAATPPAAASPTNAAAPPTPAPVAAPSAAASVAATPATPATPASQGPYRAPAQAPLPEPVVSTTPTPAAALPPAAAATRPATSGPVASLADLYAGNSGLPDLRLSLHVYDADPSRRYLLLNGMRLREGDALPDGPRVERITEDGAIMGWRGRRFLMPRGE